MRITLAASSRKQLPIHLLVFFNLFLRFKFKHIACSSLSIVLLSDKGGQQYRTREDTRFNWFVKNLTHETGARKVPCLSER
jgi:hypothetical protein